MCRLRNLRKAERMTDKRRRAALSTAVLCFQVAQIVYIEFSRDGDRSEVAVVVGAGIAMQWDVKRHEANQSTEPEQRC